MVASYVNFISLITLAMEIMFLAESVPCLFVSDNGGMITGFFAGQFLLLCAAKMNVK